MLLAIAGLLVTRRIDVHLATLVGRLVSWRALGG
jgi:hypothetical protein